MVLHSGFQPFNRISSRIRLPRGDCVRRCVERRRPGFGVADQRFAQDCVGHLHLQDRIHDILRDRQGLGMRPVNGRQYQAGFIRSLTACGISRAQVATAQLPQSFLDPTAVEGRAHGHPIREPWLEVVLAAAGNSERLGSLWQRQRMGQLPPSQRAGNRDQAVQGGVAPGASAGIAECDHVSHSEPVNVVGRSPLPLPQVDQLRDVPLSGSRRKYESM